MNQLPSIPTVALTLFALTYLAVGYVLGAPTPIEQEVASVSSNIVRGDATGLQEYLEGFGSWAAVASIVVMIVQAMFLPIPGFVILFANGLAFGFAGGVAVSLAGYGVSASLCFAVTRGLGRRRVEWIAEKLALHTLDRWLTRYGANGVFVLRLMPGFAFDGVSYAAGLTGMRYPRFLVASVLGSTPQTLLFVFLGERASEHLWLILIGGMAIAVATLVFAFLAGRRAVVVAE
ncbi:MAG: TVP38/TMEM64 family protein [Dehalococcoidia bacterium]